MTKVTNIRFIPLAAESLGVRSMCTYVETPDIKILIDPGVSLGKRFGLSPHPKEYKAIERCRTNISCFASKAEIVAISHYHFDHMTPAYTDYIWNFSNVKVAKQIYNDKLILAKDTRASINPSQRRRGWIFKKTMGKHFKQFRTADDQTFVFGKTKLQFSKPVFHGENNTPLGWTLMLTIEYETERVTHASDVQGPILDETLNTILDDHPQLVYVSGPPLYLMDYTVKRKVIKRGLKNLTKLVDNVPTVILDHHLLRAENWKQHAQKAYKKAQTSEHELLTAAEFLHKPNNLLEYRRTHLYDAEKPSQSFIQWTRLPTPTRKTLIPPT
jgi:predicted metallo-beta-lactamase superfamily hydrolase